jgi:hypothetical protein
MDNWDVAHEELRMIRYKLKALMAMRLQGPLSAVGEATYRQLCQRERSILEALRPDR